MALPKRRFSRSRRDKRRTQLHVRAKTLTKCSQCGAVTLSHRLCSSCGYYRGRQVAAVKTETKKPS
ncbi:MAG: 50S ribosomal protein L32 [Candidatus Omnitrophica bacterium]|nr:50S ribosomal protein L32 [Candidatus Omnitrophota bacterium]